MTKILAFMDYTVQRGNLFADAPRRLVDRFGKRPFIRLLRICGPQTTYLLRYGIPAIESKISSKEDLLNVQLLIEGLNVAEADLPYQSATKRRVTVMPWTLLPIATLAGIATAIPYGLFLGTGAAKEVRTPGLLTLQRRRGRAFD
ncbi:MAG: hypothetical protein ACLQOO_21500 [Terriglobia bacterium]